MSAGEFASKLDEVLSLSDGERAEALVRLGQSYTSNGVNGYAEGAQGRLVAALVDAVKNGLGSGRQRVEIGEVLATLGDPRLLLPADASYWISVQGEQNEITIGRYPVTNHEFKAFVEAGGYEDTSLWGENGQRWLSSCSDPWPTRADAETSWQFVLDNQPVVGVTYYEALAYATAQGARLPHVDERVWVIRGHERRPYPWGKPFGEGNANTREEVLGRPCAVGLFVHDCTPEGVCDLAGNVAEWSCDGVGRERLIHPGAWDQPSLAAWAKALSLESPESRWAGLGFRLARD